jgi:hypothetical protein
MDAAATCNVAINVLERRAFSPASQHFILLFNKICRQQPGGDEASNEGCNSGPTGHDFTDNFMDKIILGFSLTFLLTVPLIRSFLAIHKVTERLNQP